MFRFLRHRCAIDENGKYSLATTQRRRDLCSDHVGRIVESYLGRLACSSQPVPTDQDYDCVDDVEGAVDGIDEVLTCCNV